jgi:hypothetical protein
MKNTNALQQRFKDAVMLFWQSRAERILVACLTAGLVSAAGAQWSCSVHVGFPGWQTSLYGNSIGGTNAIGGQAHLWTREFTLPLNLHPAGADESIVYGLDGAQQVGRVDYTATGADWHAGVWNGSAASFVDLNPAGATWSTAYGVDQGMQVGEARFGFADHAGRWSGTAASWVDLHPAGASHSSAAAVHNGIVCGYGRFGTDSRAGYWTPSGTWVTIAAASNVDYFASDIHEGQITGTQYTYFDPQNPDGLAFVYNIATGANVYLFEPGFKESGVSAVFDRRQVGQVDLEFSSRAAYWTGTAESFVNLHEEAGLPTGTFDTSGADDIWVDHNTGYVYVLGTVNHEPALWQIGPTQIIPSAYSLVLGQPHGGGLTSVERSDNVYLQMRPGVVFSTGQDPVQVEFTATFPSENFMDLNLFVEGSASAANVGITIDMYDYDAMGWVQCHSGMSSLSDTTYRIDSDDPNRWISASNQVRCRIRYRPIGPIFAYPWTARLDWIGWRGVH